ncbi:DUF6197 family protein [Streptomyces sp. NPDC054784]
MSVRLDEAAVAWEVNTTSTPIDWRDAVTAPDDGEEVAPVAALLRRAADRIRRDGWCRDTAREGTAVCLLEAIHAEARSHEEEGEARRLLRRALGGDPVPEHNRRLGTASEAVQVLTAAALATL